MVTKFNVNKRVVSQSLPHVSELEADVWFPPTYAQQTCYLEDTTKSVCHGPVYLFSWPLLIPTLLLDTFWRREQLVVNMVCIAGHGESPHRCKRFLPWINPTDTHVLHLLWFTYLTMNSKNGCERKCVSTASPKHEVVVVEQGGSWSCFSCRGLLLSIIVVCRTLSCADKYLTRFTCWPCWSWCPVVFLTCVGAPEAAMDRYQMRKRVISRLDGWEYVPCRGWD